MFEWYRNSLMMYSYSSLIALRILQGHRLIAI